MKKTHLKSFKYNGKKFTPVRQFTREEQKTGIGLPLRSIGINNYDQGNWNYEDFYKEAKKAGAGEIDIFLMEGKHVVPATNELFEYRQS